MLNVKENLKNVQTQLSKYKSYHFNDIVYKIPKEGFGLIKMLGSNVDVHPMEDDLRKSTNFYNNLLEQEQMWQRGCDIVKDLLSNK